MEVIINLSYPPQLQEEHKDPYVLDQDNNKIQQSFENKSCSKWPKNILGTILEVIVILSYPPQQSSNEYQIFERTEYQICIRKSNLYESNTE